MAGDGTTDGLTKKELANIAGYTYRRLYDIDRNLPAEKKLFVEREDGKYDLALFVQRWVDYNLAANSDAPEDFDVVKARHEEVKMQKTQLEVDQMRGQLVDVQDVKKLWGNIANTIMQAMIHLPSTIAPMVQGLQSVEIINSIIDAEIRRVLNGLAETPLPEYAGEDAEAGAEDEEA